MKTFAVIFYQHRDGSPRACLEMDGKRARPVQISSRLAREVLEALELEQAEVDAVLYKGVQYEHELAVEYHNAKRRAPA